MLKEGWEDQHCVAGSGLTSLIHRGRDKRAVLLLQESCSVATRELYCCYKRDGQRAVLLLSTRSGGRGRTEGREFTSTVHYLFSSGTI